MNVIEEMTVHPFVQSLGWTLLHFVWQGIVVAAAFAGVNAVLRRHTANVRYLTASAAMLVMMACVPLTFYLINSNQSVAPVVKVVPASPLEIPERATPLPPADASVGLLAGQSPSVLTVTSIASYSAQEYLRSLLPWIVGCWVVGVVVLSMRLFGGWTYTRILVRSRSRAASEQWCHRVNVLRRELGIDRTIQLLETAAVEVPLVVGWLRPALLLPVTMFTGLSPDQIEAILIHELAHIRRHDYLVNILQTVVETLLFYHPAVWWISKRMRVEREYCCDDIASSRKDTLTYVAALSELERRRGVVVNLAVAATDGSLLERISRLCGVSTSRASGRRPGLSGLFVMVVLSITLMSYDHSESSTQFVSSPTEEGDPDWSPDGRWIAYSSDQSGNNDIWIQPVDAGEAIQITDDPASDRVPRWSPDGTKLLFVSNRSGAVHLWTISSSGGKQTLTQITGDAGVVLSEDTKAAWSPDGNMIVFESDGDGNKDLWITSAAGGPARQLTDRPGDEWSPDWSPDGKWIAYNAGYHRRQIDLWVIPSDGGTPRQLTSNLSFYPSWSPDGKWICFSTPDGKTWNLWLVPSSGGTPFQLTELPAHDDLRARWSPDGTMLAFERMWKRKNMDLSMADVSQMKAIAGQMTRQRIAGQVTFGGNPLADVLLRVKDEKGTQRNVARASDDGRYQIWVDPGSYEVSVVATTHADPIEVTVEAGEQIEGINFATRPMEKISEFLRRAPEFEERFGLKRPWDSMADAPALIRRHRGMVATALTWLNDPAMFEHTRWRSALDQAVEVLAAMDADEDYLAKQRGESWSAYYSRADGSGQPFEIFVPEDFDPQKKIPLVVYLHWTGKRPIANPEDRSGDAHITVAPWGRGGGYYALGEDDILEVIAHMKAWYPIDHDRVYLRGKSRGGLGSWVMASRHPDLFAAIAPYYSYPHDLPFENLRNVSVFSQHGMRDWVVPIDHHRWAINRIQQLGYPAYHLEHFDVGHAMLDPFDDENWMLQRSRPDRPISVTYSCQNPERGKAYWLHVRAFADAHLRAHVQARIDGYGKHQSVMLSPRNISVLELDASAMPIDRGEALSVQVGQKLLQIDAPVPDQLFVVNEKGWQLREDWSGSVGTSRPYRPGAAANLYEGEPLMIVYGTQGTQDQTALNKRIAERLADFPGNYGQMTVGGFAVKTDDQITEDDLTRFNIILIGGQLENSVVARMSEQLPFQIDGQNELVVAARRPLSLNETILRLFYFNPLNPQRSIALVILNGGQPLEEDIGEIRPHLLLGDSRGNYRGDQPDLTVLSIEGTLQRAMQFTTDWKWLDLPGADRLIPASQATAYASAAARAHAIHHAVPNADFGLGQPHWRQSPDDLLYDPTSFSHADMGIVQSPRQTAILTLTGSELVEFYDRWIQERQMVAVPSIDPEALEPDRVYRVASQPVIFWLAGDRRQNFNNVQSAPDWDPAMARQKLFGGT